MDPHHHPSNMTNSLPQNYPMTPNSGPNLYPMHQHQPYPGFCCPFPHPPPQFPFPMMQTPNYGWTPLGQSHQYPYHNNPYTQHHLQPIDPQQQFMEQQRVRAEREWERQQRSQRYQSNSSGQPDENCPPPSTRRARVCQLSSPASSRVRKVRFQIPEKVIKIESSSSEDEESDKVNLARTITEQVAKRAVSAISTTFEASSHKTPKKKGTILKKSTTGKKNKQ